MLEMVALQNVVVEHKKALANAIGAELTKQVRALGLPDAKVWISFDGNGLGLDASALVTVTGMSLRTIRGKKKQLRAQNNGTADRRVKHVWPDGFASKATRQPFYLANSARKKKGLPPLTVKEYIAGRQKDQPEKNG